MINRFITVLLTALVVAPPAVAVTDIFIDHEAQRDALRGCDKAIVVNAEIPAIPENAAVIQLCEGVGRITPVPKYNATENELETLVTLAYLEAGGESNEIIRCVVEVVFNRLQSGIWGETLTEVIYAAGEFDPAPYIADFTTEGNFIVEDKLDEIREIINDVYYNGSSIPGRVMFFRTDFFHAWEGAVNEFSIGNVYFSSSRWCEG